MIVNTIFDWASFIVVVRRLHEIGLSDQEMLSPFIHNNITYVVVVGRGGTREPNLFNRKYQLENNESSE